jgi:hypothetical protein
VNYGVKVEMHAHTCQMMNKSRGFDVCWACDIQGKAEIMTFGLNVHGSSNEKPGK